MSATVHHLVLKDTLKRKDEELAARAKRIGELQDDARTHKITVVALAKECISLEEAYDQAMRVMQGLLDAHPASTQAATKLVAEWTDVREAVI